MKIYARALDNIYAAVKGYRIIDRFGFDAKNPKKVKVNSHVADNCMEWKYDLKSMNWINEGHASWRSSLSELLHLYKSNQPMN